MNTLVVTSMTDPYDKVSECVQFTIDTLDDPFVLNDVMTIGREYTFSVWLLSDSDMMLTVGGETFDIMDAWKRHSVTFTADSTDLSLNFGNTGVYYVYRPQLEVGNVVTDWTPAPEDQVDAMEARFSIESDKIEARFEVVSGTIDDLTSAFQERYYKTIKESADGISITDSNGVYEIQVDNVEGVTIRKNGEIRSQLIDDDFYTGNIVVEVNERAQFGNFAFIPRSDGSLSFLKVGD